MVYSFESHNAVPRTHYTKSNFSSPQRESSWNDISWTKSYENPFTDTHCLKRTYNTWLIEFQYELIGIFEHRKSLLWGKWQILNAFVMITMIRRVLIWIMTCLSKLPANTYKISYKYRSVNNLHIGLPIFIRVFFTARPLFRRRKESQPKSFSVVRYLKQCYKRSWLIKFQVT